MKAITVWQPWATLLATGQKHNETRSWRTNYRGEILIHAAKKPYTQIEPMIPPFERMLIRKVLKLGHIDWRNRVPTGCIIGKATLVDCVEIDENYIKLLINTSETELHYGDYTLGRYAWVMENPVLFDKPIPAKGKQGLWNWEGELE